MEVNIIEREGFQIAGKKVWITGQENEQFGQFWQACREQGLFQQLDLLKKTHHATHFRAQTGSALLGVSCINGNPADRAFYYWIAVELAEGIEQERMDQIGLETIWIPAGLWSVFPCRGKVPESIMKAEMFAFGEWLPRSSYLHAGTFEMEVYPPDGGEEYCEFWMPVRRKEG